MPYYSDEGLELMISEENIGYVQKSVSTVLLKTVDTIYIIYRSTHTVYLIVSIKGRKMVHCRNHLYKKSTKANSTVIDP